MTEGYGKWLEQARKHGLSREALDDATSVEQIVKALTEFILTEGVQDGVIDIRVRLIDGQAVVERIQP